MFGETHYMDSNFRAMDLAEKMAERRRQSLATTGKPSRRTRLARMIFALAASTGRSQAEART